MENGNGKGIAIPTKEIQALIESQVDNVLDNPAAVIKGGNPNNGFRWGPVCHAKVMTMFLVVGASIGATGKAAIAKFVYGPGSESLNWGTGEDKAPDSDIKEWANAMGIGMTALVAGAFTTKHLWNLYTFLYYQCDDAWRVNQANNSLMNRFWGFNSKGGNRRIKSKGNRKTKKRN
jgi:hypothetical protein